jgi:hypothetical protein
MKMLINPLKGLTLFAFLLAPVLSKAGKGDNDNIEKKRTISKTYNVGADDKLSIENSFGNITVTTWNKDVIQVDIEIGVRATSDEKAQQMLDQISVSDHQGGKEISFKTDIGHMSGKKGNNDNGDGRKFYVDYKVSMPAKNPLTIENSFGKINIPDFLGTANLTSKFGELTTGKISNAKLIHVEFGKADIGKLNDANVILKFNSNSQLAGISGNSKVDVQFCSKVNITVDNSVKDLSLFQSYSTINLYTPENLSAEFNVYTNFGSFKNKTGFNIEETGEDESSGPKFDKNYLGKAGSGNAKIKIKSSFGSVRLVNIGDKSIEKEDAKDKDNDDKDDDKDDDDDKGKVNL